MNIEPPAFLVGEEGFNLESFVIQTRNGLRELQMRKQIQGIFVFGMMVDQQIDRTISLLGEGDLI